MTYQPPSPHNQPHNRLQGQPGPGMPQQPMPQQPMPQHPSYPGSQGPMPPQGFGPPPPPRRKTWPWVVFPLVAVLVAGGVVAAIGLSGDDSSGGGRANARGSGGAGSVDCGNYCVAGFPYLNACRLLPPKQAGMFGSMGKGSIMVDEIYADPLPANSPDDSPTWTFGVQSVCSMTPSDTDAKMSRVSLTAYQYNDTGDATVEPNPDARPLSGASGAMIMDLGDGAAEINWTHGNAKFMLDVTWDPDAQTPVAESAYVKAYNAINAAADHPTSAQTQQPKAAGGQVQDGCAVFTGDDFQKAVGFVVDPTRVERRYSDPKADPDDVPSTSCRRTTAPASQGFPQPPGTTYLEGALAPDVTVRAFASAGEARQALTGDLDAIDGAAPVAGIGDEARFGVSGSDAYVLQFVKGSQEVEIRAGLTNGTKNWTAADMQAKLGAVAHAIAARM